MQGSCNCKGVEYASTGEIKAVVNCHCNLCRKMNGSAFSTYVVVAEDGFKLSAGTVKTVKVSEHASKAFCPDCGTPIYNQNPKLPGLTILHLGSIDEEQSFSPALNIFCESQLDWVTSIGDLTSMPQGVG